MPALLFFSMLHNNRRKYMKRDLYDVICSAEFTKVTFGIYNKIYDDRFVDFIETKYGIRDDIDNYHYFDLKLTEDEQKMVDMHSKSMMDELRGIVEKLSEYDWVKYYVNLDIGLIRVIKPIKYDL